MTSCAKSSKTSCSLVNFYRWPTQRTLTLGVRITVQLVFSLARLDWTERENILLFAFSEAVESKLGKTGDQLYSETTIVWCLFGLFENISFQVEPAVAALENLGLLLILTSRSHWLLL